MNLTVKNKFYIYLASLFAVLCGMIFAGWFVAGIVKKDGEKLTQLKSDLFQIQKKREKALEASEEYNSFKSSIDLANATILPRQDELKFIVFIEDIANNNRLNHETNITTPAPKDKNSAPEPVMNFQVTLSGSFAGILKFIKEVETGPYYANISNINLKRVETQIGTMGGKIDYPLDAGDVEVSLIVKVYSY